MQIDFFVLDSAPQPLGEDVVSSAASSIHADLDLGGQQAVEILRAGEVTAPSTGSGQRLVAVPDVGYGLLQGMVHCGEHEVEFERLAQLPADDEP